MAFLLVVSTLPPHTWGCPLQQVLSITNPGLPQSPGVANIGSLIPDSSALFFSCRPEHYGRPEGATRESGGGERAVTVQFRLTSRACLQEQGGSRRGCATCLRVATCIACSACVRKCACRCVCQATIVCRRGLVIVLGCIMPKRLNAWFSLPLRLRCIAATNGSRAIYRHEWVRSLASLALLACHGGRLFSSSSLLPHLLFSFLWAL